MTKEKFLAYEKVRKSGKVNMFMLSAVVRLSRGLLDHSDCFDIIKNYDKYEKKYGGS